MVVEGGKLIRARRRLPAKGFVRVAGAEKCLVREPVKFSHPGFGLGTERNTGRVRGAVGNCHLSRRQIDFWRMAAAGEKLVIHYGRKRWRQSPRHAGPFEK